MSAAEGYVDVEGGRIWYRIVGGGSRTPLVLLHGGPGVPSYYLNPLEKLADERPVIFYDQLGAGRSEQPDDSTLWRTERFVDELTELRASLGLDDVHILGHSWGTMLMAEYMLTDPAGVRSLIFSSPALSTRRWIEDAAELRKALPAEMQAAISDSEAAGTYDSQAYQDAVAEYYKRYLCRRDPWPDDVNKALEGINVSIYNTMWGPSEFTATGTLESFDRGEALSHLKIPVLFTAGRYDEATPETTEYYRSQIPGAKLEIFEQSAHFTMQDEPAESVRVIRDFLREIEAR